MQLLQGVGGVIASSQRVIGLLVQLANKRPSMTHQGNAPTLNTAGESGCLFKVLSVEVFNLLCDSTSFVETQPKLKNRAPILNRVQAGVTSC